MYLTSLGEAFVGPSSLASRARLFSQSSAVERGGAWSLVLRFVSTCDAQVPFAPRGPGARANVCDSDASTFPSSPAHLSARHMAGARGRGAIVLRQSGAALQRLPSRRTWFGGSAAAACRHGYGSCMSLLLPLNYCRYGRYVIGPHPVDSRDHGTGHSPDTLQQTHLSANATRVHAQGGSP